MKVLTLSFVLMAAALSSFAQKPSDQKWTNIASPRKELSVSLPANFLTNNESDHYRVYSTVDGVEMRFQVDVTGQAKSRIASMKNYVAESEYEVSRFERGDFIGYVSIYEKGDVYSMRLDLASANAFYTISALSKNKKNWALNKFLYSVKLENLPLFNGQTNVIQDDGPVISIAELKTSPSVLQALKSKDAEKSKIKSDLKNSQAFTNLNDLIVYSRDLIILRKPRANYSEMGRMNGVSGNVILKINFRADGQIGEMIVLKTPGSGLETEAVIAARKIKFLPAEIDGKPVDVTRQISYSFTIYEN